MSWAFRHVSGTAGFRTPSLSVPLWESKRRLFTVPGRNLPPGSTRSGPHAPRSQSGTEFFARSMMPCFHRAVKRRDRLSRGLVPPTASHAARADGVRFTFLDSTRSTSRPSRGSGGRMPLSRPIRAYQSPEVRLQYVEGGDCRRRPQLLVDAKNMGRSILRTDVFPLAI